MNGTIWTIVVQSVLKRAAALSLRGGNLLLLPNYFWEMGTEASTPTATPAGIQAVNVMLIADKH